eukprot:GFUD01037267.1.p1 GENE.GFUD01037267.1~~GFUD01037267.1.p1  ORF type:complete len:460 (-),score=117.99 GFUD01037267.1:88-1467(-)
MEIFIINSGFTSYESHESIILGDNSETLLNIEREGEMNVIVTISGLVDTNVEVSRPEYEDELKERFALSNTFSTLGDVGHLQVKVVRAEGISPEYVWKRNPFTVLQVGNSRVQTHSSKGTVVPEWNKTFQFDITDVYEVLEVIVFDDNGDFNYEFLGKVQIPLLNIENGTERWYRLKDQTLRNPAKGETPRILLEMKFCFNIIRASSCVFKPKPIKYEENYSNKFEFSKFKLNAQRVKKVKANIYTQKQKIMDIFEWRDPFISFCALIIISAVVWNFASWMIPLCVVLVLTVQIVQPVQSSSPSISRPASVEEEEITEETTDQVDGEKTMMETLDRLQQRALWMQEGMGNLANAIESLENVFNFTVPCISWFLYILFMAVTILLYFVPLRVLVLVWVINRFRKGLLKNRRTNNKLENFLSRVPDNEELKNYEELVCTGESNYKSLFRLRRRATKDSNII